MQPKRIFPIIQVISQPITTKANKTTNNNKPPLFSSVDKASDSASATIWLVQILKISSKEYTKF